LSRRHARIMISGEHATIEDLGSKNGTTVDGRRIRRLELGGGERILFGTIAAMFRRMHVPPTETVR
jgi:pSer/pThr/pTyr-binding forkhead associated (FHA) protein